MERLPKYISYHIKKYQVAIPIIGGNKNAYIGRYNTLPEAILARDNYLRENPMLHKIAIKNPAKGVSFIGRKYKASLQFKHGKYKQSRVYVHIGQYDTLEEAIQARLDFIENLK